MATRNKTVWGGRVAASFVRVSAITLLAAAPLWAQPEARLSDSLRRHVASKSKQKIDVIVHGNADEIESLAARRHLTIKKIMSEGAVFEATGADLQALSTEVDHLSRDVEVSSFMAVTDPAIGADQVHARGFYVGLSPLQTDANLERLITVFETFLASAAA